LNDFRGQQREVFDQLVTQVLPRLLEHDLIDLHRVAQDGTGSFRRGEKLAELVAEAKEHLVTVTRAASDPALLARRAAAMKRARADRSAHRRPADRVTPSMAGTTHTTRSTRPRRALSSA
jgi:hypothetical protein